MLLGSKKYFKRSHQKEEQREEMQSRSRPELTLIRGVGAETSGTRMEDGVLGRGQQHGPAKKNPRG